MNKSSAPALKNAFDGDLSVTLLVTTRSRLPELRRLFKSLAGQTFCVYTLLLGDQNPEGYLDALIDEYQARISIQRFFIGPQSLSRARNLLLPHVCSEFVALTDDDCYYAPDALEKVSLAFAAQPQASVIIGNPNAVFSGRRRFETRYSIFKNAPSWVLFFRAEAMRDIGCFDESMGVGSGGLQQSGEETDYLIRALLQKHVLVREPSVHIFHDMPPLFGVLDAAHYEKTYGYGVGRMQLLKKYRYSLWFQWANLFYPLSKPFFQGIRSSHYSMAMFLGRLRGLLMKGQ